MRLDHAYTEYAYMQPTVDEICRSLTEEPERWVFDVNTFYKKGSSVKYWNGFASPFTEIWTGRNTSKVFSIEQGREIRRAYKIARETQANLHQQRVIQSMKQQPEGDTDKPWWKFWE